MHPVHPKWSVSYWFGELAVPALSSVHPVDVHVQSVHPVVCAFGYNKPSFLLDLFVVRVVAVDR